MRLHEFGYWTARYTWADQGQQWSSGWVSGAPEEIPLQEWGRVEWWYDGKLCHSFLCYMYNGKLRVTSLSTAAPVSHDNYLLEVK